MNYNALPPAAVGTTLITHVPSQAELMLPQDGQMPGVYLDSPNIKKSLEATEAMLQPEITDDPTRQQVHGILARGVDPKTNDELWTGLVTRNEWAEMLARERLAKMAVRAPGSYEVLRDNRVVGFHGTRSIALAGIIETGLLMSARAMHEMRSQDDGTGSPLVISGEHTFQAVEGQDSISFSSLHDIDAPTDYAESWKNVSKTTEGALAELRDKQAGVIESRDTADAPRLAGIYEGFRQRYDRAIAELTDRPGSLASTLLREDFPVLIGLDGKFVQAAEKNPDARVSHSRTLSGQVGKAEFRPLAVEIPVSALPVFAVPANRVDGLRQLFKMHNMTNQVIPLEDLGEI